MIMYVNSVYTQYYFIAPSHPSRSDQAVNAHTTRAPAPPLSHQGGGA